MIVTFLSLNFLVLLKQFMLMMMGVATAAAADCQYDFSPCSCSFDGAANTYDIACDKVPMADVAVVFQSKPVILLKSLQLTVRSEGDTIPADLLGQSRFATAGNLRVEASSGLPILEVDPNAFRSSKNSLGSISLVSFDTGRMDFDFLTDFTSLTSIQLGLLKNLEMSLPTLPILPALTDFSINSFYADLNKLFSGSVLKCNGLKKLEITGTTRKLIRKYSHTS